MKTLIVEGDDSIRNVLVRSLGARGIDTTEATSAADAVEQILQFTYDVIILDIGLEDGGGAAVLDALHAVGSTAHVIVVRDAAVDRIHEQVLALGAHDHVVEPIARAAPAVAIHVDGVLVDVDDAALRMYGAAEKTQMVGRSIFDFVASQSLPAVRSRVQLSAAGVEQRSQVSVGRRLDGVEFLMEARTEPTVWDGRSAVAVSVSYAVDSERLQHLATGVLGEVSDAVIVTDTALHIRLWNPAAERLYGWAEADVLGRHVVDVLRVPESSSIRTLIEPALLANGRWAGEVEQTRRDGATSTYLLTATLLSGDDGRPAGVVLVNRPAVAEAPKFARSMTSDVELLDAITRGELVMHYQPIFDLDRVEVVAAEGLVRWQHPSAGLIDPGDFVRAAERDGSIVGLGRWVAKAAAAQLAAWRAEDIDIEVALNVSTAELTDVTYTDSLSRTFEAAGLDLSSLWLEVTETTLVEDFGVIRSALSRLVDLGARIAIDDFGTGWASLTYLREFPVHSVKIDRSFVAGLPTNPNDRAIVRSVLALGEELGLEVIAEGIETDEQAEVLADLGCRFGQGYLFAKPAPAAHIRDDLFRRIQPPPG